ncbi:hypothetical protein [Paenibacillus sp. MBLB4367]|uniref:hypothetical protein n=1 Tax=Paenibacillus sp. MBLB4367 TaxID=3384767 RepID=UPI003907F5F2
MAGIHIHPHDILDEGPERIMERIGTLKDVRHLFPAANMMFERNPYPVGILPHNPKRSFVQSTGAFHLAIDTASLYPGLFQRVDESIQTGSDPLRSLLERTRGTDYEVVPWFNVLNGDFAGHKAEANAVVDFRGNAVDHWLCPNGEDVVPMWSRLLGEAHRRYGCRTFMIDRIRFPDWAGKRTNPSGLFSCFCGRCRTKMEEQGLNPGKLIEAMENVAGLLGQKKFGEAQQTMSASLLIQAWVRFRQESVTAFVGSLIAATKEHADAAFWLDLWPPSYAWLLGQDYAALTKLCGVLKHFPYHKLGGGADVQGLIEYFAADTEERENAFQAFMRLFRFDYDLSYGEFQQKGYPIRFIGEENARVRALSAPGTQIYSGVQMWNLPPEELADAITAAKASAADDLIYYCYGWAGDELFATASGSK